MTKGRKNTFDERVEIASYCIAHNHNYAETAKKYDVSYQQARNYTIKFESNGMLYDTGARVQELADLNTSYLHLREQNPFVTLIGKGRKSRNVPLLKKTVQHLQVYLKEFHPEMNENPLFYSLIDGKPHRLSTDSISLVLKSAADKARESCGALPERIHCHMIRKTKAMDLYKNGVTLPFIMQLFGHESILTTSGFYVFATLEMMSESMNKAAPTLDKEEKLWKKDDMKKLLYSLD